MSEEKNRYVDGRWVGPDYQSDGEPPVAVSGHPTQAEADAQQAAQPPRKTAKASSDSKPS